MKAFVNEGYAALGRAIACSAFMFITVFCAVGEELSFALPESNDGLPGEGPIRRYEWFQNLWVSRRALWADTAEADRGATIFLGDNSVTFDSPIGDKNNSPVVIKKYPRKTNRKGIFPLSPIKCAVDANIKKPKPS